MSKVRQMSRAAQRAASRLQESKAVRFRLVGVQVTPEVEILDEAGKVMRRGPLANEQGVVTLHLVEVHIDKLGRGNLMGVLAEAGIRPTD